MAYGFKKGDLRALYEDAVGEVHQLAHDHEHRVLMASKGAEAGDVVLGGVRALGGKPRDQAAAERSARDAKELIVNQIMQDAAALEARLAQLFNDRDAIFDELAKISERQSQLAAMADQLDRGDLPSRNPDGSFVDRELEALIARHEKEKGHAVDRSDPAAILAIVQADQEKQQAAYDDAQRRLDEINRKIVETEAKIDELQEKRTLQDANHTGRADRRAEFQKVDQDDELRIDPADGSQTLSF